jgi:hypothetical protein
MKEHTSLEHPQYLNKEAAKNQSNTVYEELPQTETKLCDYGE